MLVGGAIVFAVVPIDFIPDMLAFVGQIDDAYLISLSLLRLLTVSDARVVREHWRSVPVYHQTVYPAYPAPAPGIQIVLPDIFIPFR